VKGDEPRQATFDFFQTETTGHGRAPAGSEGELAAAGEGSPAIHADPVTEIQDLETLAERARACQKCGLRRGCRGVVFGEGNPHADLMLVGEAPGGTEDELGRPFVGAAGQLLNRILAAAGFEREEVYITNVCKCRPPGNRAPLPVEVDACFPYLLAQIRLIKPRIMVCLGASAARGILDPRLRITRERGIWREKYGILIMPTFHPAALLRDPSKKRPVWEDFKKVREEYLKGASQKTP